MSINISGFGDLTPEKLTELIRISETSERYEDMCRFMSSLVKFKTGKKEDLTEEERNLLSVAFKNVVGQKRAAWRTLSGGFDDADEALVDKYKALVEDELEDKCKEVLALLTDHLVPVVASRKDETEVFYLKMVADYYRYLAEFRDAAEYKEKAKDYYGQALDVAKECLKETHPTRLGLALNFSVCYYEILKEPEKACELAKQSFDDAIEKLDTLNDANYRDATLIMQLLRDNLTLWTSEQQEQDDE
jgi:tetratricopeptide (TPR) repeat protein